MVLCVSKKEKGQKKKYTFGEEKNGKKAKTYRSQQRIEKTGVLQVNREKIF